MVEKEYLVYVSDLVSDLPEVFNLNTILEWSNLAGGSSNVTALKPASGVTTHMALCKMILNVIFLVVVHNPQTWLLASYEPARSSPVLARKTLVLRALHKSVDLFEFMNCISFKLTLIFSFYISPL